MSGDSNYRLLRRFAITVAKQFPVALRDRNHYWSKMALRIETATRLGDNMKLFYKVTITRRLINGMVRDSNGVPVKNIKDCLIRWKNSLRPNSTLLPLKVDSSITICLQLPPKEKEITSIIHKFTIKYGKMMVGAKQFCS